MPFGNTEPFGKSVKSFNKSTAAQIALGKICIRDTTLTPDGYKTADASGADGPFTCAVDVLAATTDSLFSGSLPGTEVIVRAAAALEPGVLVKTDASGDAIAHVTGTDAEIKAFGRYLGKENTLAPSACSIGDAIRVKQLN